MGCGTFELYEAHMYVKENGDLRGENRIPLFMFFAFSCWK